MGHSTSTLEGTERRLRPLVLCAHLASIVLGVFALGTTAGRTSPVPWMTCAATCLLLEASNTLYVLQHRNTTVGMLPVSVVALASPLALVLSMPSIGAGLRVLCTALFVCFVATILVFALWFWRLRDTYAHAPSPDDDAVVIVLGGAIRNGEPRPTLQRRLDAAASLWREAPMRTLVLSGGPLAHEPGTEAEAMARYLEEQGVPHDHLALECHARNTAENVELSLVLIDRQGIKGQRCVLSSDYHLYRAVAEGSRFGCALVPIPARTPWSGRLQQWCREVLTLLART